jgi:pimeloyl-ACP methyl ester carboxylesterase
VSPRLAVNGIELAYTRTGASVEGSPPLVLVHGFMGNSRTWDPVIKDVSSNRAVLTYDHRGHGESTNTGDADSYTFAQLVADFAALVDGLDLDRFHLLGHSMGGIVAMRYAVAHPERVTSLIAMDTGAAPSGSDDPSTGFMRLGIDVARTQGMQPLFDMINGAIPDTDEFAALREQLRHDLLAMDPLAFAAFGTELLEYPSFVASLGSIAAPTTVLVGESDSGLRGAAEVIAGTIPNAVLSVIPNAAHNPHQENTLGWLEAVGAHFQRL